MKSLEGTRCDYLLLLMLGLLTMGRVCSADSAVEQPRSDPKDPLLQAVYDYVRFQSTELTEDERDAIVRQESVKEVHGWPFQEKLVHHRLVSYPKGESLSRGAFVVAVDDMLLVQRIKEPRDFNEIIRNEGVAIRTERDAEDATRLYFMCSRAKNVLYYGWENGLNIVSSMDDIRFVNKQERAKISKQFPVNPPTLSTENGHFQYSFFAWDNEGRGLLEKYDILLDQAGIVKIRHSAYREHVGTWNPER